MRHAAKIDWWIVLAVLAGTLAPLPSHTYWVSGMVLAILLVGGYPQSYETTPGGLLIRSGLFRRLVPYEAITFVGPATEGAASVALSRDRVKVAWGPSELLIAPADAARFFADVAARAPHLLQRGPDLVAA
ncbi:MAG TPA: PH domain-containing protein [Bryobacteraceae bacterium]|jgi:hypothetical protein